MTKEFLHQNNIKLLLWPEKSLDLNIIENVWAILKSKINERTFASIDEMILAIEEMWFTDISIQNAIKSAYNSIPIRIRACLRSIGAYIPY